MLDFISDERVEIYFCDPIEEDPNIDLANAWLADAIAAYEEGRLYPERSTEVDPETLEEKWVGRTPEEARERRCSYCGTHIIWGFNSQTMKPQRGKYYCGLWRDRVCEACFMRHVNEVRGQIQGAWKATNGNLWMLPSRHSAVDALLNGRYKRQDYFRLPSRGEDHIFMAGENLRGVPGARRLKYKEVFEPGGLDYEAIADIPSPHRRSGSLGKPKATATRKDTIKVLRVTIDHSRVSKTAMKHAILKMRTEGKSAPSELTYAAAENDINANIMLFVDELKKEAPGSIVAITAKNVSVDLSCIHWDEYIQDKSGITAELVAEVDAFVESLGLKDEVEVPKDG